MGMIDTLLKIEQSKSITLKYKCLLWEVVALMCTHSKVVQKLLVTNHELYKDLKIKLASLAQQGILEGD